MAWWSRKLPKKRHRDHAASDRDLYSGKIPNDPDAALAKAMKLIGAYGWKLVKRSGKTVHGRRFTMTLRRTIWLVSRWDDYSVERQARILWHELVHIRQRKRLGHAKFLARYMFAGWRWALETAAYRETVRAKVALGAGPDEVRGWVERKLPRFREGYALKSISRYRFETETRKLWLRELNRR